jgi:hypothetical protein
MLDELESESEDGYTGEDLQFEGVRLKTEVEEEVPEELGGAQEN